MERGWVHNLEIDYVDEDGRFTPVEINAAVLLAANGLKVLTLCRDISERKRAEEALAHKTMILEAHLQTTIGGILAVDSFGHAVFFNKRFSELWGIPQHILDEKNDAKMLEYVSTQLKDPAEFSRRVPTFTNTRTKSALTKSSLPTGDVLTDTPHH